MKVKVTIEFDPADRHAIAREVYKRANLASYAECQNWIEDTLVNALRDISFNQMYCDEAQIDAFEPKAGSK